MPPHFGEPLGALPLECVLLPLPTSRFRSCPTERFQSRPFLNRKRLRILEHGPGLAESIEVRDPLQEALPVRRRFSFRIFFRFQPEADKSFVQSKARACKALCKLDATNCLCTGSMAARNCSRRSSRQVCP